MKLDGCPAFDLAANVTFYAHINLACTAHSTLLLKTEVHLLLTQAHIAIMHF